MDQGLPSPIQPLFVDTIDNNHPWGNPEAKAPQGTSRPLSKDFLFLSATQGPAGRQDLP